MRKLLISLAVTLVVILCAAGAEMMPQYANARVYHHIQAADAAYCGSLAQNAATVGSDGTFSTNFCSHLPVVRIDTKGQELTQTAEVVVRLEIIDKAGGHNHVDTAPAVSTDCLIKIRGNSSSRFDKKQYRLTFVQSESDLTHRALKVMGMPSDAEWVLNGPFLDKSLLRNYLMYNLAGELMDWAPNVRYCEVFMDGKYRGVYIMLENVKVDNNRVDVTKAVGGKAATGYLLTRERIGDTRYALNSFGAYSGKTINELGIVYPGALIRTEENAEYIRQDIGRFEKALYSIDYDTPGKSYEEYINVASFVDYYLLNEFALNVDGGGFSTYAHKALRGKLTMGPVWDFNNGFDNYEDYTLYYNEFYIVEKSWYVMLFRDEKFVETVIARWRLLREGALKEERLLATIDEVVEFLGPAVLRNEKVWTYEDGWLDNFDMDLQPLSYDRNPQNYDEAVERLKESIVKRGRFLDEYIDVLRQFSAESAVKEWN